MIARSKHTTANLLRSAKSIADDIIISTAQHFVNYGPGKTAEEVRSYKREESK